MGDLTIGKVGTGLWFIKDLRTETKFVRSGTLQTVCDMALHRGIESEELILGLKVMRELGDNAMQFGIRGKFIISIKTPKKSA